MDILDESISQEMIRNHVDAIMIWVPNSRVPVYRESSMSH